MKKSSSLVKKQTESFCVLNIRSQLRDIIERHFMSISGYSSQRKQNPNSDLNEKVSPPAEIKDNEITFNFVLGWS